MTGLLMSDRAPSPESVEDEKAIVKFIGIEHKVIAISPMLDAWRDKDAIDESL